MHAAFVNTKWYEKWSERTLFVDPIINDVRGPGVLTRKADLVTVMTQDTPPLTVCSVFVGLLLSQVDGRPGPRLAARVVTRFSTFFVRIVSVNFSLESAQPCDTIACFAAQVTLLLVFSSSQHEVLHT